MIKLAENAGTCKGSTRALNLVYDVYEREINKENPKRICILKEILHNEKVIEEFNNLGIDTINSLKEVNANDIVIIRAHGEPKSTYDFLENNNIEYYDATCPKVKKIHEVILNKYQSGYEIIIIGNKDHPEVIGSNGWCDNTAVIIENENDILKINSNKNRKFITCQTTVNKEKFDKLCTLIKDRYNNYEIEVYNAICLAVTKIIESSCALAKNSDVMFVIGGKSSSNTEIIYQKVQEICPAYKFSQIKDFMKFILESDLKRSSRIGITGGASTPIKEIYNFLYLLEFLLFYKEKYQELQNSQNVINRSLKQNNDNEIVQDIVTDFSDLNKDGKYIRGVLIALGEYLANNNNNGDYLNLAYAYEMFQTSVLIHDDIIDNAKIRRGKETIPRRICKRYLYQKQDKSYQNDVLKLANSLGICAGDLGFYEANKLLIKSYQNNKNLSKILELYNDIIIKTIKGEIIDVALPFLGKYNYVLVEEQDILDIYNLKTSWYTIIGPFLLGYLLGGKDISEKIVKALNKLGLAFQIKDDILGIFANSKVIGKSNTSDCEEFKQTILYSYIMNTSYKEEFSKIYGKKNITEKELNDLRRLLKESGSLDYALDYLDNLGSEFLEMVEDLAISEEGKNILKGLLIYINEREK